MIGVMFTWDKEITDTEGRPLTKVFMYEDGMRLHGVKQNGLRPINAYIFQVQGSGLPKLDDSLDDWLHKSISYALHPQKGKVTYQTAQIKEIFSF